MSSTGAICKDDENGDARVFVTNGSPPFEYRWSNEIVFYDENSSASRIDMLSPGFYSVQITDAYGCKLIDSIEVKSNPKKCIKFYKVFSPNDDIYNPIWNIENIEMYLFQKRVYRKWKIFKVVAFIPFMLFLSELVEVIFGMFFEDFISN